MKLEWPPENTLIYPLKGKEELTIEIPLVKDKSKEKQNNKGSKEQR